MKGYEGFYILEVPVNVKYKQKAKFADEVLL